MPSLKPAHLLVIAVGSFLLATNPVVGDAAGMITGAGIKDGTVTTADIKDRSPLSRDFKPVNCQEVLKAQPAQPDSRAR